MINEATAQEAKVRLLEIGYVTEQMPCMYATTASAVFDGGDFVAKYSRKADTTSIFQYVRWLYANAAAVAKPLDTSLHDWGEQPPN